MSDEQFWTKRDGTRIAVGDMDIDHLRNTLRMIIRKERYRKMEILHSDEIDYRDISDAQAYHDLANPKIFFPLLDGVVYGSIELQKKHGV